MADKQLSIRLSLDGATKVVRDLTAAGGAGDKALKRIADAASPASRALQAVSSVASDIRVRLEGMASRLGLIGSGMSVLGPVGLAAAAGIAAVGGAFVAGAAATRTFVEGVVDTSKQFEKFGAILKVTEGSSASAQKALSWVQNFAQTTPYEVAEVTDAFVRLRSYGMDPMNGLLQSLGDTAAAMGKPLSQAVEAIADAVTGENERLKEFGIKASKQKNEIVYTYELAGKQMTATADANSRKMIEATLLGIWNKKFAGAMDELSKTWTGITSNLSDAWTNFQVKVGNAGVFESLKSILARVLDYITQLAHNGALDRIAQVIAEPLTAAFTAVGKAIDDFVASQGGIEAFSRTVEGYIRNFIGSITGGATSVNDFAALITEKMGAAWKIFSDLAEIITAVASAIRGLIDIAGKAGDALNSVNAAVTGAGRWIYENVTAPVKNAFTGMPGLAAAPTLPPQMAMPGLAAAPMLPPQMARPLAVPGPSTQTPSAGEAAQLGRSQPPALAAAVPSARPAAPQMTGPFEFAGALSVDVKAAPGTQATARTTRSRGPIAIDLNQGPALALP